MSTHKQTKNIKASKQLPYWQHKHFYKGLVILFSFSLFANAIPNKYNLDDELVTRNHRLTSKGISAIPEIFTSPYYQDDMGYSYEYRPVVLASFAIEHQIFGDNPQVSHFFNVVLYSLCCLVLFHVLLLLFANYSPLVSLAITLLFIAHPAHTEVVCSIKNRDEILGLLFSFLSLFVALKAILQSKKWLLALVPVFFTLALMSKITVISFVFLIPIAIIFFTEAQLSTILLTTLLLQIPSYFLLNLSNGFEKIMAQVGITTILLLFYGLVNFQASIKKAKSFVVAVYTKNFQEKLPAHTRDVTITQEYGFKDVFKGLLPEKKMFAFRPFIIAAALSFLYLFFVANGYTLVGIVPITLLLLIAWKGEEKISWWATALIGFSLSINFFLLTYNRSLPISSDAEIQYAILLFPYLVYQLFYGKRSLFIPTLVSIVIINFSNFRGAYSTLTEPGNWNVLYGLIPALLAVNRYFRFLFMILFLMPIIEYPSHYPGGQTALLNNTVDLAFLIVVHFRKREQIFLGSLIAAIIILFHFYHASFDRVKSVPQAIKTIAVAANQINPQIISTPQDRPLNYVEECVNMNDPVTVRLGTSLEICFHYAQKVILPYPLAFYYGYKFIHPQKITDVIPLVSLLIHILLVFFAFFFMYKDRTISYGLFIYLISVVVFSNYVQYVPGMLADRFLLIPSLGWCIVAIGILRKFSGIADKAKDVTWAVIKPAAKYAYTGILLLYSVLSFARNGDWKDDLTLFRHDIEYVNESSQAHNLLALHLMGHSTQTQDPTEQKALIEEALVHFKKAQEIYPPFFNVAYDIGRVYTGLNLPDSAIQSFEYALTLNNDLPELDFKLGDLYAAKNNLEKSTTHLYSYIQKEPTDFNGYNKLSYNLYLMKKYDESIAVNKKAAQMTSNQIDPYTNIGRTFIDMNQKDSARFYLYKAKEIDPNNPNIQAIIKQQGF